MVDKNAGDNFWVHISKMGDWLYMFQDGEWVQILRVGKVAHILCFVDDKRDVCSRDGKSKTRLVEARSQETHINQSVARLKLV